MSKKEKITKFVEKVFNKYQISIDLINLEKEEEFGSPIFQERTVDERTIGIIANMFGVEPKVIENCDEERIFEVYNNYSFFKYIKEFNDCEYLSKYNIEEIAQQNLLNAIFGAEYDNHPITPKYIPEKIIEGLKDYLVEMDKIIPGTLHKNADILNLNVDSEDFFSYSKMTRLLNSFFKLLDRTEELFFKALDKNLTKKEIKEYNTFITYLDGRDLTPTSKLMFYNYICKNRELFKEEGYNHLLSYVHIASHVNFEPWKCGEFSENKELAQKYVNYFPASKDRMTWFNMLTKNILCQFTWSDAKRDAEQDEFDELFGAELNSELNKMFVEIHHLDKDYINILEKERTRIYLPKLNCNRSINSIYSNRLQKLILPPKKGGLTKVPEWYESISEDVLFSRIKKRLKLRKEGK